MSHESAVSANGGFARPLRVLPASDPCLRETGAVIMMIRLGRAVTACVSLNRYVFREVAVASLVGTALFTLVLFLQRVEPVMELLVGRRVPADAMVRLLALTLPQAFPFTIPMGVLTGILVSLGTALERQRGPGHGRIRYPDPILGPSSLAGRHDRFARLRAYNSVAHSVVPARAGPDRRIGCASSWRAQK